VVASLGVKVTLLMPKRLCHAVDKQTRGYARRKYHAEVRESTELGLFVLFTALYMTIPKRDVHDKEEMKRLAALKDPCTLQSYAGPQSQNGFQ
jgi:hypothetical protein